VINLILVNIIEPIIFLTIKEEISKDLLCSNNMLLSHIQDMLQKQIVSSSNILKKEDSQMNIKKMKLMI
jgi:hypothetical protein